MYTVEEFDKEKSKVLKYVLYKKRSKQEVKNKFYNTIDRVSLLTSEKDAKWPSLKELKETDLFKNL